jgi:hypothetical protein
MENPVVDLNLTDSKGRLNIKVKEGKTELTKAQIAGKTATIKEVKSEKKIDPKTDLKDQKDAAFSQTENQKKESKPVVEKKEPGYKNRFAKEKDRHAYHTETGEEVTESNPATRASKIGTDEYSESFISA